MKQLSKHYLDEFLEKRVSLIKSRIRLAAVLYLITFSLGNLLTMFILGFQIDSLLMIALGVSAIISLLTLYFVPKIKTVRAARSGAILFVIVVLVSMARYQISVMEPPFEAATVYLFMFLGFSLIFPWEPKEIVEVLLLHEGAFALFLLSSATYYFKDSVHIIELPDYLSGIIMMFLAFIVCFIVAKRERERELENFILLKDLEKKNNQMKKELELATRVHERLIPKSANTHLADIAVTYSPAYYIGGDYAKFHIIEDDKLIFLICDVTGHGVPAALLVNRLHTELENLVKETYNPGELLKKLNQNISDDFEQANMFLTVFCGLLDFESMEFLYSSYGHLPQYLFRMSESVIESLESQATVMGIAIEEPTIYQAQIAFDKGDQIFLFTDGVTEAMDENKEEFGPEKLKIFMKEHSNSPVNDFNKKLLHSINLFTNGRIHDDVFILNIKTK